MIGREVDGNILSTRGAKEKKSDGEIENFETVNNRFRKSQNFVLIFFFSTQKLKFP